MKTLGESEVYIIMKQIFRAICYCHDRHIVHRDLKPENIVFTEEDSNLQLKVIDFGKSKILKPNEKFNELAGTVIIIMK